MLTRLRLTQRRGLAGSPTLVLCVTLVVTAIAAAFALRLRLHTSIVELLPTSDPAVANLERTQARTGDPRPLLIGIRSPDRAANLRYAAALTRHLRSLPPRVCAMAAYQLGELRDFFERHRWLYAGETDLEDLRDGLRGELVRHKNPLAISLDDDDGRTTVDRLGERLRAAAGARERKLDQRFPGGAFVNGDYVWVAALPPGGVQADGAGEALLGVVRAFVAANPPAAFHRDMKVMPSGSIVTTLREREAVEHDVVAVTLACLLIISLSIVLYFRSLGALPLVVVPAVAGTLVAFAAASLAFGYLSSSTAFLGSIILGNGINHAIVLLARYREQRATGQAPAEALAQAIDGVWRGTLAAALAAAAAYGSLMLTSFRGFSQFGLMGAVGSLACWIATFVVVPALLRRFRGLDRAAAIAPPPRSLPGVGRLVGRHPGVLCLVSLALSVVAVLGVRHFAAAPFEYDFRKLSTQPGQGDESRQFDGNMNTVFGRWHAPMVLLADRLDQVEPLRQAIRAHDDQRRPSIGEIVTVYDVLPGSPAVQQRKLALLAELRKLATDPAVELLDADQRRRIRENVPPADLRALEPEDLPALVRQPFTEVDGRVGRPILVYHASDLTMWNGHDLLTVAGVLQTLPLPDGSVVHGAGAPMVFGAMLRSILHDGPRATALALGGVLLVVCLVVRPFGASLAAMATMLLGALWMLGAAGIGGVRITFLNFIALPITFGIGSEYAINIVTRLRRDPDAAAAVASTGGAVALCSWTTIVGYGSLLAARSQALRGFGAMAILGELACLAAAVLALPALLVLGTRARAAVAPAMRPGVGLPG